MEEGRELLAAGQTVTGPVPPRSRRRPDRDHRSIAAPRRAIKRMPKRPPRASRRAAALPVLVMLASGLLVPMTASADPPILMSVTDGDTRTAAPGGSVVYNISIQNTGSAGITVNLSVSGTPAGWTAVLSSSQVSVPAGFALTVNLTVGVPGNATFNDTGVQMVAVGTYESGGIQTALAPTWTKVSRAYGVRLGSEDPDKACGQGDSVAYEISVMNTGNLPETIDLAVEDGKYKGWAALGTTWVQPDAGDARLATVTVSVPEDQSAGSYPVTIRATVRGFTDHADQLILTTSVYYGVGLTTNEARKTGRANETITFNVTVTNRGSGNDTFDLSLADPHAGWLMSFEYDNFELARDKSRSVMLTLRIDKDARYENYAIGVRAASDGDSTKIAVLTLTVAVERISAVRFQCDDPNQTATPGRTVMYAVRLTNEGNGQDTFNLRIQDNNHEWASLSKGTTTLGDGMFEQLYVTVSLPADARAGTYVFTLDAWPQSDESALASIALRTTVVAVFSFQTSAEESSLEGEPGDSVSYILKIENTGNSLDTYDLQVRDLPSMWTCDVSPGTLSVAPRSKTSFAFTVNISGDYAYAKAGSYSFSVRLASVGNDSIQGSVVLTTVVLQVFGLELNAELGITRGTIDPYGDDKEFILNVNNAGNGEDTVTFKIKQCPAGWSTSYFSFIPTAIMVPPGNYSAKQVRVLVSASHIETDAGTYTFDVVAISKDGNECAPTRLKLDVVSAELPPTANLIMSSTVVTEGDLVQISVPVRNVGTAGMRNVLVSVYANDMLVAQKSFMNIIEKGATELINVSWKTNTTGNMNITARVSGAFRGVTYTMPHPLKVNAKGVGPGGNGTPLYLPSWSLYILAILVVILSLPSLAAISRTRRRLPAPPPQKNDAHRPPETAGRLSAPPPQPEPPKENQPPQGNP